MTSKSGPDLSPWGFSLTDSRTRNCPLFSYRRCNFQRETLELIVVSRIAQPHPRSVGFVLHTGLRHCSQTLEPHFSFSDLPNCAHDATERRKAMPCAIQNLHRSSERDLERLFVEKFMNISTAAATAAGNSTTHNPKALDLNLAEPSSSEIRCKGPRKLGVEVDRGTSFRGRHS